MEVGKLRSCDKGKNVLSARGARRQSLPVTFFNTQRYRAKPWLIHIPMTANTRTHTITLLPRRIMDILMRSWTGPAVIWDERCLLSKGETGPREHLLWELEGELLLLHFEQILDI